MDFLFPNGFHYPDIPKTFALTGEPPLQLGPVSYPTAHLTMPSVIVPLSTVA